MQLRVGLGGTWKRAVWVFEVDVAGKGVGSCTGSTCAAHARAHTCTDAHLHHPPLPQLVVLHNGWGPHPSEIARDLLTAHDLPKP